MSGDLCAKYVDVNIWCKYLLEDQTYDVIGLMHFLNGLFCALHSYSAFITFSKTIYFVSIPQYDLFKKIVTDSPTKDEFITSLFNAIRDCKLQQFIKTIAPRVNPQYILMFNGWGYEMPERIIINRKMASNPDADLAFLIHSAIRSLNLMHGLIYTKMKHELINFLIKISYNIKTEQLCYINDVDSFSESEYNLFIECIPDKWLKLACI